MILEDTRLATALPAVEVQPRHSASRHGALRLVFARQGQTTVLHERYCRVPLQVMRAIDDGTGCANVYLLSPTGGVVQGDRYEVDIAVERDAHALLTTLAATKVYRMPQGKAVQQVRIELKPGAILEYVPEAAMLFADADYEQQIDIVLHDGALLIFQDAIMAGRRASGEDLQFRRFVNRLTVRDCNGLLLHERQDIRPESGDLDRVGLLEGFRCWASWYVLGDLTQRGIDAESLSAALAAQADNAGPVLWSVSRLQHNGLAVRLVSGYWSTMAQHLEYLRQMFRRDSLGLPAPLLRK